MTALLVMVLVVMVVDFSRDGDYGLSDQKYDDSNSKLTKN